MGLVVAGVMHLEEIQAQGVGNHAEAGKAHGCGTGTWGSGSGGTAESTHRQPAGYR